MKSLADYSAFNNPNSPQNGPPISGNSGFAIVFVSIVFGVFFALLAFGVTLLGNWMTRDPQEGLTCGAMCFDEYRLAIFLGIGIALEGAAGVFFASLVLLSVVAMKPPTLQVKVGLRGSWILL